MSQQQRSKFTPPSSPTHSKQDDATRRQAGKRDLNTSTTHNNNTRRSTPSQQPQQQQPRYQQYSSFSSSNGGGPSFMEDPAFLRAESRKRRFDQPGNAASQEAAQYEYAENMEQLSQTLRDMNDQVDEMRSHVSQFADEKTQYFDQEQRDFDPATGERLPQYDAFGNLIDQSLLLAGGGLHGNGTTGNGPQRSLVKIEIPMLQITQGWLWKKGRGVLAFNRTWKRRFFQIDLERIRPIHYYAEEQRAMMPMQQGEPAQDFQRRKQAYWAYQRNHVSGTLYLGNESELARIEARGEDEPDHRNANVRPELVFHVYIPGEGTFALCAESEQEYTQWINTINYIVQVMTRNREIVRERGNRHATDDHGANGEGATYNQEEIDYRRDLALTAVHAFGKGLFEASAGYPSEFFIQVTDPATANSGQITAESLTAVMESRELHYDLAIAPYGNELGLFQVTYTPTRPGKYELSVLLNKFDIQNSPFHPTVRPAPVSAPHCVAEGTALYCGIAGGQVNRVGIRCRNLFGEELRHVKNVDFKVTCAWPLRLCDAAGNVLSAQQPHAFESEDGYYYAYYVVEDGGDGEDEKGGGVQQRLRAGESIESAIRIELDDGLVSSKFEGDERQLRGIKGSPFNLVLAESATGQALATAARHASQVLNGHQMDELLSFAEEGPSFLRITAPPLPPQQQHQPTPSFIDEAEQQQKQQMRAPPPPQQQQQQRRQEQQQQQQRLAREATDRIKPPASEFAYHAARQQQQQQEEDTYFEENDGSYYEDAYEDEEEDAVPRSSTLSSHAYAPPPQSRPHAGSGASSYRTRQPPPPAMNTSSASAPLPAAAASSFLEEELARERRLQQQREVELALEREQLLRMRRELQQGQNEMHEHLSRLNLRGEQQQQHHVSSSSSYLPPPPAQYRRTAASRAPTAAASTTKHKIYDDDDASSSSSAPPPPQRSNPFDAEITAMFNSKARELKRIFRTYAAFHDGATAAASRHQVTLPGFVACWVDYEICPTFISKREVEAVYRKRVTQQGLAGMDFPVFVEALGLVAFAALDKPPLSGMYATPAKRIGVLLHMWRFGDSVALDNIVKKHKYGRS